MITPEIILTATKCGDIFSKNDESVIKAEYRQMARICHPDSCGLPNSAEIFGNLNKLYHEALSMVKTGKWESSNMISFRNGSGKEYRMTYLTTSAFELGVMYISDKSVMYMLDSQHKKYFDNALLQINNLKYANDAMRKEISRYMPKLRFAFETDDAKFCIALEKTPDTFRLSDILQFYSGNIPDRHVAWIISRLCNICCYFKYAGLVHNGLTIDNLFISPEFHTIMPYGGWWYAIPQGDKMIGVKKEVYDIMPVKAKSSKISEYQTDLESLKYVGGKLLGSGSAPQVFLDYLKSGSFQDPMQEFNAWNRALDAAYGERKFIVMPVSKADLYK